MKIKLVFLCIVVIMLNACSVEDSANENYNQGFPEAQAFISEITVDENDASRSNDVKSFKISFRDSISGFSYGYNLLCYDTDKYGADFNDDNIPELIMVSQGNKIVGQMNGYTNVLHITRENKDGYILYSFQEETPQTRVTYTHLSWWGCVTRLVSTPEVSFTGMFTSSIAMAGALAIICLDDNNRWDVIE